MQNQKVNSQIQTLDSSGYRSEWIKKGILILLASLTSILVMKAQEKSTEDVILEMDSIFWKAYNECDIKVMNNFLAEDLEFYHDNGGIEMGRETLNNGLKNGLCKTGKNHLRREAVEGSVEVFPLKDNGTLYGAIITGEHLFYVVEDGSDIPEGQAKFSHLWLLKEGDWKMHRVYSYDHGPVEYKSSKKPISISKEQLRRLSGEYLMPGNEIILVTAGENNLKLEAMGKTFILYPESENSFFTKDRDLAFSFTEESPVKVQIFEGEKMVAEATRPE